jgi:high-affinity nickel permease
VSRMAEARLLGVLDAPTPAATTAPSPFCPSPTSLKARAGAIVAMLVLANGASLGALALVARSHPKFVSPGILAFTFGLRHAVDADHIAAIDNVSRRLIADGQRSLLVGFWFSLGHSTVVVLLCAGVAFGSTYLRKHLDNVKSVGAIVGTSVSATVLLLVAGMNIFVGWGLMKRWRAVRARRRLELAEDAAAAGGGGGGDGYHVHVTTFGSVLEVRKGAATTAWLALAPPACATVSI